MSMRDLRFANGALMLAVLATSVSGCSKPAPKAVAPVAPLASVGRPPKAEECQAIGDAITVAVASGDVRALDRVIDWTAIDQSTTGGIDAPDQFRKSFIQGLGQSRMNGTGVSSALIDAVKKGGTYSLLHSFEKDKTQRLLFRLLLSSSAVNYHEYILARRPDGKVRATDLYVYSSGELVSESFRRLYIQAVAQGSGGMINRLTGADRKFAKFMDQLGKMGDALRASNFAEVITLYKQADPEMKKEKTALMVRLQAAQNLNDETEYEQSIADYRNAYPDDACTNILSIDYFVMKKQYDQAIASLNQLDRAVQGDPHLIAMRADIQIAKGDFAAARADVKAAQEADPTLIGPYWSLISISLTEKNYEETLQRMREIRDKFELQMQDLTSVPEYKGFTESPQYQTWLKENEAPAAEPDKDKTAPAPEGQTKDESPKGDGGNFSS